MSAFYLKTRAELVREIERLGLDIPVAEDEGALHQPFRVASHLAPNRLCAYPMAGGDGGSSACIVRRYQRSARRGFGIIWFDAEAGFARCVDAVREISPDALLVLQLWECDDWAGAAVDAQEAGFDGVDIACCFGNRLTEDPGLVPSLVETVRAACPGLLLAVRLEAYQATPGGFGVDASDYRRMDPAAPIALIRSLRDAGADLLSVTASSPNLFGRPDEPIRDGGNPHEHPLTVLARNQEICRRIREEVPELALVGGGYSWLRQFAHLAAAGAVEAGISDVVGFGRLSVVDPGMLTFAEADLWERGGPFGRRPAHDAAYEDERLRVFDEIGKLNDVEGAYRLFRQTNPLPEMTSHIRSDAWERDTNMRRQRQYIIGWTARTMGLTGVVLPGSATGASIAVIGGGPAGLAATVRLLEAGHEVVVYEREDRLGGAPALVYPEDRVPDPGEEIDALLEPAESAGRLTLHLNQEVSPERLLDEYAAVLVATGCWHEPSLGDGDGVWPALRFLRAARRGAFLEVPARVVILCGGDAAMDVAVTAKTMGAKELVLLFDGAKEDAHWHLPDGWFDTDGVEVRYEARPIGYGADGGVILESGEVVDADMVIEAMGLYADDVDIESDKFFCAGSGASVEQSLREGFSAAEAIDRFVRGADG